MSDPINPNYYKFTNGTETIDITENLNFNGGNIVKYAVRSCRADGVTKADPLEDLKKVKFYVEREIQRREGDEEPADDWVHEEDCDCRECEEYEGLSTPTKVERTEMQRGGTWLSRVRDTNTLEWRSRQLKAGDEYAEKLCGYYGIPPSSVRYTPEMNAERLAIRQWEQLREGIQDIISHEQEQIASLDALEENLGGLDRPDCAVPRTVRETRKAFVGDLQSLLGDD